MSVLTQALFAFAHAKNYARQAFLGNWVIVPVINCVTPYNALQDTLGMSHETTTQKFK